MLMLGKVGGFSQPHSTNLKPHQQVTHFTLWSMMAAPLIISCDLEAMDEFTLALLTNPEVINVNQDPLGKAATRIKEDGSQEIWARPLFDGTQAVSLFNRGPEAATIRVDWKDLNLQGDQFVRDLWHRKDLGKHDGSFLTVVQPHGAVLLKIGGAEEEMAAKKVNPDEQIHVSKAHNGSGLAVDRVKEVGTWTWEASSTNFVRAKGREVTLGMGGQSGLGIADAGLNLDQVKQIDVKVAVSQLTKSLDENTFAGFYIDYAKMDGSWKRVALSIESSGQKRSGPSPDWGKGGKPDEYVDIGRHDAYSLDLQKWCRPSGMATHGLRCRFKTGGRILSFTPNMTSPVFPTAAEKVSGTVSKDDAPPLAIAPFDEKKAKEHQAAWAKYLGVPVEMKNSIGMKFVLIPPGEFDMGTGDADFRQISKEADEYMSTRKAGERWRLPQWFRDIMVGETPQHRVAMTKPFYLGISEVTRRQYSAIIHKSLYTYKAAGGDDAAASDVSWSESQDFCRIVSNIPDERVKGFVYRLPTEAEWEYACRAGSTTRYSFGDSATDVPKHAWCYPLAKDIIHAVGQKDPNPWNLHDMHGNMWEWCADWFDATYYKHSPRNDPAGPSTGVTRVVRGGCSCDLPLDVRTPPVPALIQQPETYSVFAWPSASHGLPSIHRPRRPLQPVPWPQRT